MWECNPPKTSECEKATAIVSLRALIDGLKVSEAATLKADIKGKSARFLTSEKEIVSVTPARAPSFGHAELCGSLTFSVLICDLLRSQPNKE